MPPDECAYFSVISDNEDKVSEKHPQPLQKLKLLKKRKKNVSTQQEKRKIIKMVIPNFMPSGLANKGWAGTFLYILLTLLGPQSRRL